MPDSRPASRTIRSESGAMPNFSRVTYERADRPLFPGHSDEDVASVVVFLRSLPAVRKQWPKAELNSCSPA